MSDLKLDSLRIQNFRTFKDLTIDRLGRVNLIVGKNNVGKTALLEGVWLWNHPEYWHDFASFLERRLPIKGEKPEREVVNQRYQNIKSKFYGYPDLYEAAEVKIYIGPSEDVEKRLQVSLEVKEREDILGYGTSGTPTPFLKVVSGAWEDEKEGFYEGSEISLSYPGQSDIRYGLVEGSINFIASDGINIQEAGEFWDNAVRANQKKSVLKVMQILVPQLEDVNWVDQPSVNTSLSGSTLRLSECAGKRVPMISFPDSDRAVSLSSLGEGASRALWIGTSLVNSENGILLVDEIENGLHYSAQPDLWQLIFETAQDLDVQVFATTHSFDCIKAFQQAAQESEAEGRLISLRRSERVDEEGKIVAVPYDEDALESVAHSNIEVR